MPKAENTWKDITSYSCGERANNKEPITLKLSGELFQIILTRRHGCEGWFVRCQILDLEFSELGDVPLEEAKKLAISRVLSRFEVLEKDFLKLKSRNGHD